MTMAWSVMREGIVVTGANGLVGSALMSRLRGDCLPVVGVVRREASVTGCVVGPALESGADWSHLLEKARVVVHSAARVHVMRDRAAEPVGDYRAVNVDGTLKLARQAAEQGVRRFIFISSIKVNGEESPMGAGFKVSDRPTPMDPYAISKAEAEVGLKRLAAETGMEVVVIRPPLVYGPGVKANFSTMMHWLRRGVPLPLGAVKNNRRSLVALDNLVDLIVTCIEHPAAANRTFLVSDGEDLSTRDLLVRLAAAMEVPVRLLSVPVWILEGGATLLGKRAMIRRLCGNLQVDIASTCEVLQWRPPINVDEGLRRAVEGLET